MSSSPNIPTQTIIDSLVGDLKLGISPEAAAARAKITTNMLTRWMRKGAIEARKDDPNEDCLFWLLYTEVRKAMADGEQELVQKLRAGARDSKAITWLLEHSPVYRHSYTKNDNLTEEDLRKLIIRLRNRKSQGRKKVIDQAEMDGE